MRKFLNDKYALRLLFGGLILVAVVAYAYMNFQSSDDGFLSVTADEGATTFFDSLSGSNTADPATYKMFKDGASNEKWDVSFSNGLLTNKTVRGIKLHHPKDPCTGPQKINETGGIDLQTHTLTKGSDVNGLAFHCRDHLMVAADEQGGFGATTMTPGAVGKLSKGLTVEWEQQHSRTSAGDWLEVHITAVDDVMKHPDVSTFLTPRSSNTSYPRNAFVVAFEGIGMKNTASHAIFRNQKSDYPAVDGKGNTRTAWPNVDYMDYVEKSVAKRATFRLEIDQKHFRLSMVRYFDKRLNAWSDVPVVLTQKKFDTPLPFDEVVPQISAKVWKTNIIPYCDPRGSAKQLNNPPVGPFSVTADNDQNFVDCTDQSWHWANFKASPVTTFAFAKADRYVVTGRDKDDHIVSFDKPADGNARMIFECRAQTKVETRLFNQVTGQWGEWQLVGALSNKGFIKKLYLNNCFVNVPEGTIKAQFRADNGANPILDQFVWHAKNISIFNFGTAAPAVETEPPVVTIIKPANDATVGASFTVEGSATDNKAVVGTTFKEGATTIASRTGSTFSYYINNATAGKHTYTVEARDAAGNVGKATVSVNVEVAESDTTVPTVEIFEPVTGQKFLAGTVFHMTAQGRDNVGVVKMEALQGDKVVATVEGDYMHNPITTPASTTNSLQQISYKVRAYDKTGNKGEATVVIVVEPKDTTSPTVSIITPAANATVSTTFRIEAVATDNVRATEMTLFEGATELDKVAADTAEFSVSTTVGAHTYTVKAKDAAGNTGEKPVSVTVKSDTTTISKATITITEPLSGNIITKLFHVKGTVTGGDNFAKVEHWAKQYACSTCAYHKFAEDTDRSFDMTIDMLAHPDKTNRLHVRWSQYVRALDTSGNEIGRKTFNYNEWHPHF